MVTVAKPDVNGVAVKKQGLTAYGKDTGFSLAAWCREKVSQVKDLDRDKAMEMLEKEHPSLIVSSLSVGQALSQARFNLRRGKEDGKTETPPVTPEPATAPPEKKEATPAKETKKEPNPVVPITMADMQKVKEIASQNGGMAKLAKSFRAMDEAQKNMGGWHKLRAALQMYEEMRG